MVEFEKQAQEHHNHLWKAEEKLAIAMENIATLKIELQGKHEELGRLSKLLGSYFYVISIFYDKPHFTCLFSVIVFHMVCITCLLSAFRKDKYGANQNNQSQFMLWFLRIGCFQIGQLFEYEFIYCIRVIMVLVLLLYLRFCHRLTKGEIVRVMCFGIVNHAKLCVFN